MSENAFVSLPKHTLYDLLRMCTDVHMQRGFEPTYVRVIREAVQTAIDDAERIPEPASKPVWLTSEGRKTVCRTMPHQRPCGASTCTRPECQS